MQVRTDFCDELMNEKFSDNRIDFHKKSYGNGVITSVKVKEEENPLEKEIGDYITISMDTIDDYEKRVMVIDEIVHTIHYLMDCITREIHKVLIVGLGNQSITCDALGPNVIDQIYVTSHLIREGIIDEKQHKDISALAFGVMGQTGIESFELIKSSSELIQPDLIIIIDALMTSSIKRLNKAIQLNNVGIKPGAGIGNHRKSLDEKSLKTSIITIGVATVTSIQAICKDKAIDIQIEEDENLIVTPKSMDKQLVYLTQMIAHAINESMLQEYTQF